MMFKTHLVFGFLVALLLIGFLQPANQILFLTFVVIASILPDIDHPDSKLGSKIKIIGHLFEHRGFFHSVFALFMFGFLTYFLLRQRILMIAVMAGYFSHMAIDCLSHQGIMPFHPFSRMAIKGFIKTNSVAELIVFILISVLALYKLFHL